MRNSNLLLVLNFVFCFIYPSLAQVTPFWGYNCIDSTCVRVQANASNIDTVLSLNPCALICNEYGTLWPRPKNVTTWNTTLLSINWTNVTMPKIVPKNFTSYWERSMERFNKIIDTKIGDTQLVDGQYNLSISLYVETDSMDLNLDTDENYQLLIDTDGNDIQVVLRAFNYFGARHALETLSQLIVYNEFSGQLMILSNVSISDGPAYKHRGLLIDTVRRYYSVDSIKRSLDVMAMSKLNVFHWRITNSQSFTMVFDSHPELSRRGAYSPSQVYYPSDIRELVEYARVRGVRIIPTFDAPSNVAEGYQDTNLVTCLNAQPWWLYCGRPPCGLFDPTKDELYELLHDIYSEMNEMFDDPPQFHMGGEDVSINCWNSSSDVRDWMNDRGWELTQDGYLKLWDYFQEKALAIYRNITNDVRKPILWSSILTEDDEYLSPDDYVIQVWTDGTGSSSKIPHHLEQGYDIIISNSDVLYLDCGYGDWTGPGVNWCSPYKPWHLIYENDFRSMAGNRTSQVLGGETCSWSEPTDEATLDASLWPRVSAFGERLWSEPNTGFRGAENRILLHREFLVQYGINAESIQPEWCVQNLGQCPYLR